METADLIWALTLLIFGYLFGSIPFGLLIGWWQGVDIRTRGSGNIGATNVARVLGRPLGMAAFVLDMLKGFVPTFLAGLLIPALNTEHVAAIAYVLWIGVAAGCILGHMFPVFLDFKGGKGVATSLGVLLGVYPYFTIPAIFTFAVWLAVTIATRYVSVGSISAALAFPLIFAVTVHMHRKQWGDEQNFWPLYLFGVLVAVLVVYRHRSNLRRLQQGDEPRIGSSKVVSRAG